MKVEKEYLAKNLENIFMKMIYKLKFINCGIRNYSNNNSIIFLGEWRQWLKPGSFKTTNGTDFFWNS